MSTQTDIFVAKESFVVNLDGENVSVRRGETRVRAGHPILKGREMYFEALTVQYDVEAATARPGEKRGEPTPAVVVAPATTTVTAPVPTAVAVPTKGLTTESIKPKAAD